MSALRVPLYLFRVITLADLGMKTKSGPSFLSTGTMWSEGGSVTSRNFRHSVHTDELDHFEWVRNNGRSFGIEVLQGEDTPY